MMTTDNLQEIFDIVDIEDNVIGQATRKECNSDPGLIHRAVFVLIFNDQGQILWQKRSHTKDVSPGEWVTSVSGHVNAGESYEQTAIRESREEVGIEIPLEFLGKFLHRYPNENEYSAIYRAFSSGPFDHNREEISALQFMRLADILDREREGELKLSPAVHHIIDSLQLLQ
jgi:isopentenyl-diphosphate delta-isomerase